MKKSEGEGSPGEDESGALGTTGEDERSSTVVEAITCAERIGHRFVRPTRRQRNRDSVPDHVLPPLLVCYGTGTERSVKVNKVSDRGNGG